MSKKLIAQGAEAKIYLSKNIITKQRTKKSYRHPTLDEKIRKKRTKSEAKILSKAISAKINVPKIIKQNLFNLEIEFLNGEKLSETLSTYPEKKQLRIMQKLGKQISLLHDKNIIHGDLTTSNTILKKGAILPITLHSRREGGKHAKIQATAKEGDAKDKIFIIDFGLSFVSRKIEDKAVDIHLLKQALNTKHFQNHEKLFSNFLKKYEPAEKQKILERLIAVERRGRYRH